MEALRKSIEGFFCGVFDAYGFKEVIDPDTGITSLKKELYLEQAPCRLSFKNAGENSQSRFPSYVNMTGVLIVAHDVEILEGSEIAVLQNGVKSRFYLSGKGKVYAGHREYVIKAVGDGGLEE